MTRKRTTAVAGIFAILAVVMAVVVGTATAKPNANPYKLNKEGTLTVGMTLQFHRRCTSTRPASRPATTSCC